MAASTGEVVEREPLPREVIATVEVVAERRTTTCQPDETDAACMARVEAEQVSGLRQGQSVRVTIESDGSRILAALVEDGVDQTLYFPSYEAVSDHMDQRIAEGHAIVLTHAEQQADLETRHAAIAVIEERPEIRTLGAGLRIRLHPAESHARTFAALGQAAAPHGIEVVSWSVADDGVVVLELRCPGPTD